MCAYKININLSLSSNTVQPLTKNVFEMAFVTQAFVFALIFTYGYAFGLDQNVPFIIGRLSSKGSFTLIKSERESELFVLIFVAAQCDH